MAQLSRNEVIELLKKKNVRNLTVFGIEKKDYIVNVVDFASRCSNECLIIYRYESLDDIISDLENTFSNVKKVDGIFFFEDFTLLELINRSINALMRKY